MRDEFLPLSRPSMTEREIAAVCDVMRSGWITSGPRVIEFERRLADVVGAGHAVATTSATAGFHLLLSALGVGDGDEVITPSLTWPSPVNMVCHAGAVPVFADIDPATLLIDTRDVERRVTPRTRAVMPVHFAGQPCDLDALRELCSSRGLLLIEDAAHAIGALHRDRLIGSGPGAAVFSFHATKNLTTGEGGMVTTPDGELAARVRSLRFHGIDRDAWSRRDGDSGAGPQSRRDYDLADPGWKYAMTDMQAAIGLVQLERLEEITARRRLLSGLYDELLADVDELDPPARPAYPARHAHHIYPVLVDEARAGISRDDFRADLRRRNIGTGLHYLAVHELDYYRRRHPIAGPPLEHTTRIAASIVSLPLFPDMGEGDVRDVVEAIKGAFSRGG